jgi:hypothetical protein
LVRSTGGGIAGAADEGVRGDRRAGAASRTFVDATDDDAFVTLPYAEPLLPTEMRQVVRVAIPRMDRVRRSASPGWPGIGNAVVADVLVGEDGMARAIRIVR